MTRQALKTQTNSPQAHIYPYELDFISLQALPFTFTINVISNRTPQWNGIVLFIKPYEYYS